MKRIKLFSAPFLAALIAPMLTHADPFDPKQVPAEAKWVVHADLDAARDTKTFEALTDRLLASDDAQAKFDQIEQITGMKIPDDLHDFTLYGKDAGEESGVIIVHGRIDRNKTLSMLQMADQYASNAHGNYDVLTWLDKGKNQTMFGAFHDGATVIVGRSQKNIETALDAMDGKVESLKAESTLVTGTKPQQLIYIAATDVMNLHPAGAKPNPLAASVKSGWISLSEKDEIVTLRAELTGTSTESAADLRQSLDGLMGMLGLIARGENPDPLAKAVAGASKSFATTQKANTVLIEWPTPVEQVQAIIAAIAKKQLQKN